MSIVAAEDLTKRYGKPPLAVTAINRVSLHVEASEMVALRGPSGSGKSTLLNLLGCLDTPTEGTYRLGGYDVSRLTKRARAWVRLHYIGFVFQAFHLLPHTSAVENVALPLYYAGVSVRDRTVRASTLLERVGLLHRRDHRPNELSGGERQRVAIARAIAMRPRLLLADEPTGALDTKTGAQVLALLEELRRENDMAIVLVTHDPNVGAVADRQVFLRDGVTVDFRGGGEEPG